MSVADSASSLNIFLVLTALTGLLALAGSVIGGGFGLRSPLGWMIGSSAFLLPLLVGGIGTVVVMLHVNHELDAMDPVLGDQIVVGELTRSMYPIGEGLGLTLVCAIAFLVAGIVAGVLKKKRQARAEAAG